MTEENKIEVKEVKTCFCQSEWFKKFLTKTLAVFVVRKQREDCEFGAY